MSGLLDMYFPAEDPMAPAALFPQGLLGPSVLSRMQQHSDAQRARMASGDYSPSRMDEDAMWLADDVAGGLLGTLPGGLMMLGAKAGKVADALPMDQASRMARAQEMGFTVPAYHGTADGVDAFRGGAWVTGDPAVASDYSHRAAVRNIPEETIEGATNHYGDSYVDEWGEARLPDVDEMPVSEMKMLSRQYGEGQNVVPLLVRDKNILDMTDLGDAPDMEELAEFLHSKGVIDDDALEDARHWLDEIDLPSDEWGSAPEPTIWKAIEDLGLADDIRSAGYDGLSIQDVAAGGGYGHPATLIFDPKNIRSVHAAFDPAKRDSADLLAGMAGLSGLGLLAGTQYPYQEPAP